MSGAHQLRRYSPDESDMIAAMFVADKTDAEIGDATGRTRDSIRRRRMTMGIRRQDAILQVKPDFQPIAWNTEPTDFDTMRRYAAAHKIAPTVAAVNAFRRKMGLPQWRVSARWAA